MVFPIENRGGPRPLPVPPQDDTDFQTALRAAQTATEKARATRSATDIADADAKWATVESMIEYDYLLASQSADPTGATTALDGQYGIYFRGQGVSTEIYDKVVLTAKTEVQQETPVEQQYQLDLFEARQVVTDAEAALQATPNDPTALYNYQSAITYLLNLETQHQVSLMGPQGPNGTHTAAQWTAAGNSVKVKYGLTGELASFVDGLASAQGQIEGMLDKLKNDPGSLNLTSAEEAMRKTNPISLAVLKLAGVTIDPSKMTPEEQQIAQMDPFLYGALQKANVDISGGVGFPTITIDGKLLEMTPETRRVLEQAYRDDGVVGVALALRQLGLVKSDPTIDGLLPATSAPRLTYTTQQVALLMSQGKDIEAMAVLNANMNGALSPAEREKLLADAGLPYFGPGTNYWNQQIDKALAGPSDTSQSRIGDWDADKVGRWMQEVAKNAPPELVNMMLDAVKAKYSPDWIAGNGTAGAMSYSGVDWCKGLSLSVSVADQIPGKKRTEEFAKWIASADPEHNLLNNISFGGYNAMRASIEDGYGSGLWRAIVAEYQNNSGAYSEAQVHIQTRDIPGAISDAEGRAQAPAARAAYNNFNANRDKILQTFFDQFLDDPKIGTPVSTHDTPELRDLVGIVLDLDPNINLDQAAAHDDSVDWYDPKSYEGQAISVVVAWIQDQSKTADGQRDDGAKVAGVPFVYASGVEGVHNGGLFKITRSDGSDEFIDGTAALDAVGMSGGERVDPTNVEFKWHFDSVQQFQDDNYYDDDGDIYLPVNFRLADSDGDGHVEREDYERIDAANTTWFEHFETKGVGGTAIAGTICMFIPGGQVVGVPLLIASAVMGVGVSGYELYKMNSQGESINLSNPMARSHWMMIAGSAAGVGRLGILKWVANPGRFATGTANVLGFTATYTGFHMTAVQTQNLLVNGANMSWDERLFSVALLGSGGAQMALGGLGFRGRGQAAPSERVIGSPRQTGRSAYNFWRRPGSQNGLTSAFWRTAETDFQTNVGAPGFRAWDTAGRPTTVGNAHWNEAITQLQPEITARAQSIAGQGNPVTAAHTTQAENALAGQIGMRAHEIWVVSDRPTGGAAESVWNSRGVRRAERLFNTRVSRDGFRLWDAESTFEGAVGETAYNLWVKAGRPADQVWTDAVAKYQPAINNRAQELSGGPGTTPTAKQILQAEAEFAGRIGVEAYTNWRGNMQGVASAHWTEGEAAALGSPAYRLWVKAGKPNDQFWVDAEARYQPLIDARAQEISGAGKPVTAKAQKRAESEFAGRIGLLARENWIAAGRPATGAATAFWPQAETQFLAKIAEPAHRFWKLHGNPNDVHWTRAVADFQPQIDARAQQLSGAGNPITAKARTTAEAEHGGQISLKAREYWEADGRPGTTAAHWQLAEKKFQIQIGEPAYQLWETAGRTVGKDNVYFTEANELAQQEIGTAAYNRWTAKGGRPNGATAAHWTQADADLQTAIGEPAFRIWDTDGRPSTTHWQDAYAHFKPQIDARAQQLSGSGNTPTAAHIARAEGEFAGQIGTRAHANWDGKPAGAAEAHWMTAGTTHNNAVGGGAYQLWVAAGKPTGLHNTYWGRASQEYIKSDPYLDRIVGGGRDKWNSWGQRRADPDTYLRIRAGEYWNQGKFVLKWFGGAYAAINFTGLLAEAAYYFAGSEHRTTPAVTQQNAEAELRKYLADPDGYRDQNYENTIFGTIPVGDNLYNFKGHLFAFTGDNGVSYFRRIPEDLYNALKQVPNPQGYQVTPDGIFVTEAIKLSEAGDFEFPLNDPMQGDVDENIKLQIGIGAFDFWKAGGVPPSAAGFDIFKNAETEYLRQNGVLAYDDWVGGGKLTTGDNAVWLQATQNFQGDIDRRAQELWQQSGGQGSGPTAVQRSQAEDEYKDEIGHHARGLWVSNNKPAGTAGAQRWTNADQEFARQKGLAFDEWVSAGRPTDGANAYWGQAIEKWKVDSRPVEVQVELRPPFRVDGFGEEEQGYSQDFDHDGGFRWRPSLAVGPIEGFRPHLDLELNLGYRYNQPTVSTIRVGAPSPTQGWGAGIRQQDTSILSRFNLSVGTLDNNKAKVHDLTNPDSWWSGSEFTLYNGRLYLDVGNRNRLRIDGTKGSVYARARETGFVELGLGADFVRYAYGDNQFFSINGYYELQWYPLDYRNQVTLSGGAITKSQGFQPYPLFEIDPALQISWTEPPRITEDRIPDQNPDDRGLSWLTSETR